MLASYGGAVAVFLVWAVAVAAADLRARRIPNVLVAAGFLAAIGTRWLLSPPVQTAALEAAEGVAAALAITLPGYRFGKLGAGDVKVAAVIGLWAGFHVLMAGIVVSGALSVAWYGFARKEVNGHAAGRVRATVRLPYGAFMTLSTALVLLGSVWGGALLEGWTHGL